MDRLEGQDRQWLTEVLERVKDKLAWVSERSREKIPYTVRNGVHDDRSVENPSGAEADGINWWTNGFWGGMMWLMYHETGDAHYKEIAEISEERLDECFRRFFGLHHDVGFMWLPTSVAHYRVNGHAESRRRAMHAANLLAGRFNLAGGFIRAWDDLPDTDTRGWAIIDCMLNLPLLYWASEDSGDPRFRHIAVRHADTMMAEFIRPDGSVNHIVEFDPFHGGVVRAYGGQGYGEGSSWTRGQGWGLYGFMISYRHTGTPVYLHTAQRIAHYVLANLPDSGILPVDFRQPADPIREDDTAAAIIACGLLELAQAQAVGPYDRGVYLRTAVKLLRTLDASRCDWTQEYDGILKSGSASYHGAVHHQNIIYGDYFFMEALFKLQGNDLYLW